MVFRFHRYDRCNEIIKGIASAVVYLLCYGVCQWMVPDLSPYRFYDSAAICALLVAGNLTAWQYDKKWVRTMILYNGIVLSAAFIPLLSGQRILHEEIAHAFVMGTAAFLTIFSLRIMAGQVRFSHLRRFCLGTVYLLGAVFLLIPLLFWGYYVVSGQRQRSYVLFKRPEYIPMVCDGYDAAVGSFCHDVYTARCWQKAEPVSTLGTTIAGPGYTGGRLLRYGAVIQLSARADYG